MLVVTVSVPVIDCVPTVLKVTLNVPMPPFKALGAGNTAAGSLLVNRTVPL